MSEPLSIWILQTGEPLPVDAGNPRPMRAMNLTSALIRAGHRVVLWSSTFYHQEKRHRRVTSTPIQLSPQLEIRLVDSPGYRANIGPGRLYDHAILARKLGAMLAGDVRPPDVAFVGYPPIETAVVMTSWLHQRAVPTILDVKDQWPDAFRRAFPRPLRYLGGVLLAPYAGYARRAFRQSDGICAMTDAFLDWALHVAGRSRSANDIIAPLTPAPADITLPALDAAAVRWDALGVSADGRPRLCFIGTHSRAFDFEPVARAVNTLAARIPECQFVFAGHGEKTGQWRESITAQGTTVFPGWIDRAEAAVLAHRSLAMLAPYRDTPDFRMSVPNKVIDALYFGRPILCPLPGEVAKLIEGKEVGLRYGADARRTLDVCVEMLIREPALQKRLGHNAKATFDATYSFERVYGALVEHIERLAKIEDRVEKRPPRRSRAPL